MTHCCEQRCLDSNRQRQISRLDCEISSNGCKNSFSTVHGQGQNCEKRYTQQTVAKDMTSKCFQLNFVDFTKFGGYSLILMSGSFQSWRGSQKPLPTNTKLHKLAYSLKMISSPYCAASEPQRL